MPDQVTLNIASTNGRPNGKTFTILTEDKALINSVIDIGRNNTITEKDVLKLQTLARRGHDAGLLERCDLGAEEKLKLANLNGFNEYYDISLSNDKKYFIVKVKETGRFFPDPKAQNIAMDFGLKPGVLYENNKKLLEESYNYTGTDGSSYNHAKIKAGKTVKIPVDAVSIQDSPTGFWGRLITVS